MRKSQHALSLPVTQPRTNSAQSRIERGALFFSVCVQPCIHARLVAVSEVVTSYSVAHVRRLFPSDNVPLSDG